MNDNQPEPYYLTEEGYAELKKEYERLTNERKPEVIQKVKEARAKGSLEDNPELENVREEQMMLEGRILEIEQILENSKIINPSQISSSKIVIGSKVTVEIEGDKETYQIVGTAEADPIAGKISYESPVGKSLLGLESGDEVSIKLPHAQLTYKVITIHSAEN